MKAFVFKYNFVLDVLLLGLNFIVAYFMMDEQIWLNIFAILIVSFAIILRFVHMYLIATKEEHLLLEILEAAKIYSGRTGWVVLSALTMRNPFISQDRFKKGIIAAKIAGLI